MFLGVTLFLVLSLLGLLYGRTFLSEYNMFLILGICLAASLVLTAMTRFVLNKFGGAGGLLFGGRKANWSTREQLSAKLSQARHFKGKLDFDKAILAINDALKHDPDWPEALFIKAQIVWEGFQNAHAAKQYLKKVIQATAEEDEINQQALQLFRTLEAYEKTKKSIA